ncbi:hypothetical protein TNCV_4190391 [Trichonephila clavipes]|nr:hypothetical protein TNCV_4190391 [Trichonephila clavipes]
MKTSSVEFISRSPTPSPMKTKQRRFALLRRIFEPWKWKRRKKRDRFEQTSRTLERKISMRSTKDQLVKKDVLMPVKHNSLSVPSFLYVSDSPLVSMKKEKRDVPLRTAYSQAGRLWQPKPSSLRAQAQLMRTETCGLLNIREKQRRERQRCASRRYLLLIIVKLICLDSRTSNGKLWKLLKNISNEKLQAEQCNTILSEDKNLAVNEEQAANLLGLHYQKISRLNFSVKNRNIKIRASRIVHGCRSDTHRGTYIFNRDFRVNELEAAIGDFCLNKAPGPNGIHDQMIDHLDLNGRQRFLDIINCSWNKGQLPRDWRRATVIPIKKCGKTDATPGIYRPMTLTSIACNIMEKVVLRRLTFHLHSHNLLPEEQ